MADDYDITDVATQILLDHNVEDTDDNINTARNAILNWLDKNDYTDDYGESPAEDDSREDDVEKSIRKIDIHNPVNKNMGF